MTPQVRIVPSILAADFGRLADQVVEAEAGGADRIQIDVMDGRFVPNLTMGPAIVEAVRRATTLPLEVHLMVEEPERFIAMFAAAGANHIQVQVEATHALFRAVSLISEAGCRPAAVLSPATPLEAVREVLDRLDAVNLMSVEPGFGGQRFITEVLAKIRRLREIAPDLDIEVDGGVDAGTAPAAVAAGATLLVAGSSVFGHPAGVAAGIGEIRRALG